MHRNSHNIEHELSALYDCAHGAGLAVTFPAYLTYVWKYDPKRLVQLAVRVWGCKDSGDDEKTIMEGISAYRTFLKSIGMPQTLEELGGKADDIDTLAHMACWGDGRDGNLYGFVNLTEEQVKDIYPGMLQ